MLKKILLSLIALCCLTIMSPSAEAAAKTRKHLDRAIKTPIVCGLTGAIAGSVVGLITAPVASTIQSIFVGTSVGLYMGVAIGIAYEVLREPKLSEASLIPRRESDHTTLALMQTERARRVASSSPSPLSFQLRLAEF